MTATEKYSLGEAIDHLGFGKFQLLLASMVGFASVADAMEMMILSILSPALHCHWHITHWQQALLTTVVFLGMMISSPFWGTVADKYGRRVILVLCSFYLFFYGLLTAVAPSFNWVLFLRFLVGFFIGGMPQATTLFIEYLPTSVRGQAVLFMSFFWAIGSCFEALLAWLVMPMLGWRYLVGFSALPLLLFVCFSPYLPESPMFLAITGKQEAVEEQLDKVSEMNGKSKISSNVDLNNVSLGPRGNFTELFRSGRTRLTLSVFFLWFVCACTYYGVVLLSTEMLNSNRDACRASSVSSESELNETEEQECSVHICRGLLKEDYVKLIWTSFAEFPGTFLAMALIDKLGRKITMSVLAALFSVFSMMIMDCGSQTVLVIALFGSRACTAGLFQTVYVYTPEVYPTNMRAVALGFGSASARVGAMITPYIAQVLLRWSLYSAITVYVVLGIGAAIVAYTLPVETKGQDLTKPKISNQQADTRTSQGPNLVENMEQNERNEEPNL